MTSLTKVVQPGPQLQWEIEQFMYHEARLLDERRYEEWLALLAEDIVYEMPLRVDRLRRDEKRFKVEDEIKIFDDNLESLKLRVRRIRSGTAWSEDPRSRSRHFISNVQIVPGEQSNEIKAICAFMVYVSRMDEAPCVFSGQRQDVLRRSDQGEWQITERWLMSDQSVMPSNNLTMFF
ncbi:MULTISPECIES: aromatic-ring-hydroxylating dioxygenase subunit beta [Burkholderia]|uniref:aromatic-ring-hydroxylating dioxygenase subunit beta n=1 Tax=Burkholderia TaxID=32008 RepID=UPI000B241048|nr:MULTISPECIES: 3-phenylpropionate/cinnamic acid dioxygenase subunit beta [Burkholderia]MDN7754855.1 3-phenylpropionate/cinnamic acid dioxygenase subunit beta [Burkholderia gladioli]